MAQMIMEPPTDFAKESRSAELSLKKDVYLGGTRNERAPAQVCVCAQDSGSTSFHILKIVKLRCFCCSSVLANRDVGPVSTGTG